MSKKMFNALSVIVKNPSIRKFLEENDPKALRQCEEALGEIIPSRLFQLWSWNGLIWSKVCESKVLHEVLFMSWELSEDTKVLIVEFGTTAHGTLLENLTDARVLHRFTRGDV